MLERANEKVQELLRIKGQAPLAIDPKNSALTVADVQRWFTHSDDAWAQVFEKLVPGATARYFKRVQTSVLGNTQRLQEAFRSRGLPVIFAGAGCCLPDGRDLPAWLRDFDQLGLQLIGERITPPINTANWQIDDLVAPASGEIVLHKTSGGALASTKLDQTLHNMGINSLVVCGLTTAAVCVTQTARETADHGFRVIIAEDACTERSEEMHEAALVAFSLVFGRVRPTEEIVKLFTGVRAAA